MNPQRLLTPAEVAEYLGVARGTIYAAISRGQMQAFRIGRARRISPEQIRSFLLNHPNTVEIVPDLVTNKMA